MTGQEALITELVDSGALERPVKRVDTHAAVILLAGKRAIKIKREVRYPFLNYSTLHRRRSACEAELAANRIFAPDLYLGVLPIRRLENGRVTIGGDQGEIVEWAVEMLRFDEDQVLENISKTAGITDDLAQELARTIFEAHRRAPISDTDMWLRSLQSFIKGNSAELGTPQGLFDRSRINSITRRSLQDYEHLAPLLRTRGADGFVRHCHGDLHLGNIVLFDNKPLLFDAVEFDPAIASGDVLYDLAFLLMDLVNSAERRPANIILNEYLALSDSRSDLEGLAALPLFMSLRAAIRAKVTNARMAYVHVDQRAQLERRATSYFKLADRLLEPARGELVAVGGLSGTGKSALARTIASDFLPEPGAVVLRSDLERKAMFKVAPTDRLPASAYTDEISKAVYRNLASKAAKVIEAGFTAIVDAVFGSESERLAIESVAKFCGVPFIGLFLTASLETRLLRVSARRGDASDADQAVVRKQDSYDPGAMTWTQIDACGNLESTAQAAKRAIGT